MRGKFVNLALGLMNVMLGALIIIYSIFIPQDFSTLTNQEIFVIHIIQVASVVALGIVSVVDIVFSIINFKEVLLRFAFLLPVLSISYIFYPVIYISAICIIPALVIIVKALRENIVELNNMIAVSIIITIVGCLVILNGTCVIYKTIGNKLTQKENEGELEYSEKFFEHITELDIQDVYINVKREDGKWRIHRSSRKCSFRF